MPPAPDRSTASRDRLMAQLEPVVTAAGYDLEDVTVTSAGKRSLVRVIVDADGGIDLDAVADVSRAVSDALDEKDGFAGPFVLEVSSPGTDRPLTQPRHWRRAAGRLVTVSVLDQKLTGRVVSADDETVTVDVDGTQRELRLADLGPGKVQIEFSRAGAGDEAGEA